MACEGEKGRAQKKRIIHSSRSFSPERLMGLVPTWRLESRTKALGKWEAGGESGVHVSEGGSAVCEWRGDLVSLSPADRAWTPGGRPTKVAGGSAPTPRRGPGASR